MTNETTKRAHRNTVVRYSNEGMTLRDWFAGQALAGCDAALEGWKAADYAEHAYSLADAMLAVRESNAKHEARPLDCQHGNENMIKPKGYEAECWTPQQIMTDQHLRICSLEERIRKLRKQRDEAIRGPSCSSPSACSAIHGLHRCELVAGHDGLCECHCEMKWPNEKVRV